MVSYHSGGLSTLPMSIPGGSTNTLAALAKETKTHMYLIGGE